MQTLMDLVENPRPLTYAEVEKMANAIVDEAGVAGMTFEKLKVALNCINQVAEEGLSHLEHRALAQVLDQQIPPPK